MEAVAQAAGEPWTDAPKSASAVIGEMLRTWNDRMDDADRPLLAPLVPEVVGTAADAAREGQRVWLAIDWHVRICVAAWLRAAGFEAEARELEAADPVRDAAAAMTVVAVLHSPYPSQIGSSSESAL